MDSIINRAFSNYGMVLSLYIISSLAYRLPAYSVVGVALVFLIVALVVNFIIEKFGYWSYPSDDMGDSPKSMFFAIVVAVDILCSIACFYKIIIDFDNIEKILNSWSYSATIKFFLLNNNLLFLALLLFVLSSLLKVNKTVNETNRRIFIKTALIN